MRRCAINRPGASHTTLRSASSRGIRRSRTSLHAASSRTVAEFWISAADRGSWRHCSRRRVIVAVIGLRACRCHPIRSHTAGSTSRGAASSARSMRSTVPRTSCAPTSEVCRSTRLTPSSFSTCCTTSTIAHRNSCCGAYATQ